MSAPIERLTAALADRYRIERELGAGGMATVYLAEDLKHKRRVALKVLKPELAAVLGAERFVQEITTTAALQHPHILPLFDSGTADGFLFYVMPFIDGETLRAKLDRETQLGVDEAVRLTTDVADALHYAHEQGVIHRDIKPENILLHKGRPMVADFGIALALSAAAGGRMTETGLSLGTPHYMSPEQATAEKEINGRSDVYSLATVLYEMLAGNPPHVGASAQQIIMKIITEQPQPVTVLRKSVPTNVAAAVAKALEKLPADRFASANAFSDALNDPHFRTVGSTPAPRELSAMRPRRTTALIALVAALGGLALGVVWNQDRARTEAPTVRFDLAGGANFRIRGGGTHAFAISTDGRTIAFAADSGAGDQLWVRTIDDAQPRMLPGTEGAGNPSISPDSKWVAYVVSNHIIRKVSVAGGAPTTVITLDGITAALEWGSNDDILFELARVGIMRVGVNSGKVDTLARAGAVNGETNLRLPLVLRDAGLILFSSVRGDDPPRIGAIPIEGGGRTLDIEGVAPLGMIDGHLIYTWKAGALMAVPVNGGITRANGSPLELAERVARTQFGMPAVLSANGTLVYQVAGTSESRLAVLAPAGRRLPLSDRARDFGAARFSPDGRRLAVTIRDGNVGAHEIWVVDLASGAQRRVTRSGAAALVDWTRDGAEVVYLRSGALWTQVVDGGGDPRRLAGVDSAVLEASMMPDRRSVIVTGGRGDVMRVWVDGTQHTDTIVQAWQGGSQLRAFAVRVSPDGKWIAFVDRNGRQVYVTPPVAGAAVQVSDEFADVPVWDRNSNRLYYHTNAGVVAVDLQTSPTIEVRKRSKVTSIAAGARLQDVSRQDGSMLTLERAAEGAKVRVVVNWADDVRRALRAAGR